MRVSGERQLQIDGLVGAFNVTAPAVLEKIAVQSILLSEHFISTTFENVRKAIAIGLDEGLPINSRRMRKLIQEAFPHHKKQRYQLDRISRTETHQAQQGGSFLAAEQNGIEFKEWVTSIDGKERDSHADVNGQVVSMGLPFMLDTGAALLFPGDSAGAVSGGDVINCRCAWVSVIPDDEKSVQSKSDIWIEKVTIAQKYHAVFFRFMFKYSKGLERRVLADLEELRAAA